MGKNDGARVGVGAPRGLESGRLRVAPEVDANTAELRSRGKPQLLLAALGYAARGWRVLPLWEIRADGTCACGKPNDAPKHRPGKHPRIARWQFGATTNPDLIIGWWRRWPCAGIGIATGAGSGLVVIDVDDGDVGDASLRAWQREVSPLPPTVTQQTGSGGRHRLFRHPGGDVRIRNSAGKRNLRERPKVDIRGDGGFIVVAPTLHASGARYAWEPGAGPDDLEPAELPAAWVAELREPDRAAAVDDEQRPCPEPDAATLHRMRRAEGWLRKRPGAIEGSGGDNHTFSTAVHVTRRFNLMPDDAMPLMRAWNDEKCQPKWSDDELRDFVERARRCSRVPLGCALTPRGSGRKIASRPQAVALIEDFARAVEALPWYRTSETDKLVLRSLVEIARKTGSVRIGQNVRDAGLDANLRDHRSGARALARLVKMGLLRKASAGGAGRAAEYWLVDPAQWPAKWGGGRNGHTQASSGVSECGQIDPPHRFDFVLRSDLFRRSFNGRKGLGPRRAALLRLALVSPTVLTGAGDVKKRLGCKSTAKSVLLADRRALADAGLLDGWAPVTRDVDEIKRLIAAAERERGLAGAEAVQRAEHVRQRAEFAARVEEIGERAIDVIRRSDGRATEARLRDVLGLPSGELRRALDWWRREQGVLRRRGDVWELMPGVDRQAAVGE